MNEKETLTYSNNIPIPNLNNTWKKKLNTFIQGGYKRNKNTERMISEFVNFCKIKNGILLEVGCGSAWFRCHIPDVKYIGLEVLIRRDIDINFPIVVGVGERLPFKDNSVDYVLILATLDHVSDPLEVLKESFRILKKEGNIYILSAVKLPNTSRKIFVYGFLLFQKILFFDYESICRNFRKITLEKEDKYHTFEFTAAGIEKMLLEVGYSGVMLKNFLNTCFFKGKKY